MVKPFSRIARTILILAVVAFLAASLFPTGIGVSDSSPAAVADMDQEAADETFPTGVAVASPRADMDQTFPT